MALLFDIDKLDNLNSLHAHEEELRAQSLKIVATDPNLSELLFLVSNAMGIFFGFSHDHKTVSIKLALGGYVQQALSHIRDVVEVAFLLDYFRTCPEQIKVWRESDKNTRLLKFGPKHIRTALDDRDGNKELKRKKAYDVLCEYATHATYPGFTLINKDGHGQVGPFVDEIKLRAWLQEVALRVLPAAELVGQLFPDGDAEVVALYSAYRAQVSEWWGRQQSGAAKERGALEPSEG
jgi:hypothetical protein